MISLSIGYKDSIEAGFSPTSRIAPLDTITESGVISADGGILGVYPLAG